MEKYKKVKFPEMNGGHHAHHDYDPLYGPLYGSGRHSPSPPSSVQISASDANATAQQHLATLTAFSAPSVAANSPMDYSVAGKCAFLEFFSEFLYDFTDFFILNFTWIF